MRVAESRAIFCATALSSMALTVSRSWYSKSSMQGVELGFEFAGAGLLLGAAFDFEAERARGELVLAELQGVALGGGGGELRRAAGREARRCRRSGWSAGRGRRR